MRFDRYHQHFVSAQGPRDRRFSDEPGESVGDGGGGSGPEVSSESSFEDIGRAAFEASESSAPEGEGDGGESASPEAPATGETGAAEGGQSPAEQASALLASVQGEAMKLDPEALPEELRPFIKQFQADYTRKTQQLADQRKKAAEELAGEELAELRQQIAELQGRGSQPAQQAPQQQGAPDIDAFARARVEAAYGPLVSQEEFFAATDNATVTRFLNQQTMLAATKAVAEYHLEVANPALQGIQTTLSQRQQAEVYSQYQSFVQANPDLVPYEAEVAALYSAGKPLEEAAALVRKAVTADDAVTRAMATGAQIGEQRAKQVAESKDKFDVPHSSTAGKGGPNYNPSMSYEEIAQKAAREAGVI